MALTPLQFSGRSLVPDALGAVQQGQQISQGQNVLDQQRFQLQQQQLGAQQAAEQQGQAQNLLARQQGGEKGVTTGADFAKLMLANPQLGERLRASANLDTDAKVLDFAKFGFQMERLAGDRQAQDALIQQRVQEVTARGGDPKDTMALLQANDQQRAQAARAAQLQALNRNELAALVSKAEGGGKQGVASAVTELLPGGGSRQGLPSGEIVVKDEQQRVLTGQAAADFLQRKEAEKIEKEQKLANVEIGKQKSVAEAKTKAERTSSMRKDQTERLSQAARGEVKIREALTLAEKATQGAGADVKLLAAKVFPGIDVSNESALAAAMTSLAVDQLQRMKGPSTDFEFGKMEQISGSISDPKAANIAKLKVAQRAAWFAKREAQQFNKFIAANGDPDLFSFDINEKVTTKRGPISLQDIQETAAHNNISMEDAIKRFNQ